MESTTPVNSDIIKNNATESDIYSNIHRSLLSMSDIAVKADVTSAIKLD